MMDLTGTTDGTITSVLRPWLNLMASVASRFWISLVIFAGMMSPAASAQLPTPFATGVTSPGGGMVTGTAINQDRRPVSSSVDQRQVVWPLPY